MDQGLKTALERIEKEAQEKTGTLDLSDLGLTETPPAVFELTHLTKLALGYKYGSRGQKNIIREIPTKISTLTHLLEFNLSDTNIKTLAPLKPLSKLKSLNCNRTQVTNLAPLKNHSNLQSLHCSHTQVDDLAPLKNLSNLQTLNCHYTQVENLTPLKNLSNLRTLFCSNTQVDDLSPLKDLLQGKLTTLFISGCPVRDVPPEILSGDCASALNAHFTDLGDNPTRLTQFKILIVGNGRVGKTQIARALQGKDMKENDVSTHAISTISHDIFGDPTLPQARIWDFGGQDIYHGTHALFMKGRAVTILAWNQEAENDDTHEYEGQVFKNEKLPYWTEFIRRLSGHDNPLIITQTRCDQHGEIEPEIDPRMLKSFIMHPALSFDADTKTGLPDLLDYLRIAQRKIPRPLIGPGRLAVKEAIETLKKDEPNCKFLPFKEFEEMCVKTGGVSDPRLFAEYLHHADVFFYREGLFGDKIILDTNWMLEAIYAVLNRKACKVEIERSNGRFTLGDLGCWLWNEEYSDTEQAEFLEMMRATGICFQISPDYSWREDEKEKRREIVYIAPELLPADTPDLGGRWDTDIETIKFDLEFEILPDPVFRAVMSRLGGKAGLNGVYWKTGLYLYETKYESAGLITLSKADDGFAGIISVETQKGDAQRFCDDLTHIIYNVAQNYGFSPTTTKPERLKGDRLSARAKAIEPELDDVPEDIESDTEMSFGQQTPSNYSGEVFVSYSWANKDHPDLEIKVDALCAEAEERGIKIWRDKDDLGIGQSIDVFMNDLAQSRRCFIFLSEKYLHSEFCMFELYHLWEWSQAHSEQFHERVRIFNIDAKIFKPRERLKIAKFWQAEYKEYSTFDTDDYDVMSETSFGLKKKVQKFALHTDDILTHIARTVQPESFEAFLEHGFSDL